MTHKWVCKEVPRVGAFERNHTKLVCRVSIVAKELDSNARVRGFADIVSNDTCLGHSDEYIIGTFEDTCVGIACCGNIFCFGNKTLLVEKFVSHIVSWAWHLIKSVREGSAWYLAECKIHLVNLLADYCRFLRNLIPEQVHLLCSSLQLICISAELRTVPSY